MTNRRRCYLCHEWRPKDETEVTRQVVPSALMGGLVEGVNRYVRKCRVGYGCKGPAPSSLSTYRVGIQ